ncbi:MAG: FAD-dependent oxidoreductase [Coriobacteriia bacterium]|nr:FAD-dependent oxidoreductase [Coriobacteriia bacterium]
MDEKLVTSSNGEGEQGKGISRRDLLKYGALSAVGVAGTVGLGGLAGCSSAAPAAAPTDPLAAPAAITADKISETKDFDVVVVGAGASGVPAAFSAQEAGAKVGVLTKGATAMASGNTATAIVLSKSDPAGPATLMRAYADLNQNRCDWKLIEAYVAKSEETLAWIIKQATAGGLAPVVTADTKSGAAGVSVTTRGAGFSPKPINQANGMQALAKSAEKAGVQFFYKTPAVQLVKENGKIVAVIGKTSEGKYIRLNAKKGVILAAGDYSNNDDMVKKYNPDCVKFSRKQVGATGDGILMGMWADAVLEPIPHSKMIHDMDSGPMWDEPFLRVNDNAERFANEEIKMGYVNNTLRNQPHTKEDTGWYCQIFDGNYTAQVTAWGGRPTAVASLNNYMPEYTGEKTGVYKELTATYSANTLADLAKKLGLPADALQKTVDEYNKVCALGYDAKYGKTAKYLQPITTAPFYGIRKHYRVSAIVAGLIINENCQCLDPSGKVIPGLYAAGMNAGGIAGGIDWAMTVGGMHLGRCHTQGRIAGQHAAKS